VGMRRRGVMKQAAVVVALLGTAMVGVTAAAVPATVMVMVMVMVMVIGLSVHSGGAGGGLVVTVRGSGFSDISPTWTVVSMPQPRKEVTLSGLACATAQSCEAVGRDYPSGSTGVVRDVAEGWNGRRWRTQRVPAPPGRTTPELSGVSCTSPQHCVAVGAADVTYQLRDEAVIDVWNGKRWTAQRAAQTSATDTELDSVSCVSARFCMSVGEEKLPNPDALLVSEVWNGRAWKAIPVPIPAGRTVSMTFSPFRVPHRTRARPPAMTKRPPPPAWTSRSSKPGTADVGIPHPCPDHPDATASSTPCPARRQPAVSRQARRSTSADATRYRSSRFAVANTGSV
jgi:hypothetical protein